MKRAILTFGLFSLVMVLTSFTTPVTSNINVSNITPVEIVYATGIVGGNRKVDATGIVGGNRKVDATGIVGGNRKVDATGIVGGNRKVD